MAVMFCSVLVSHKYVIGKSIMRIRQEIQVQATAVVVTEHQDKELLDAVSLPRQFRAVALDLDGTLLHSDHKISTESAEYLRELDSQGVCIMIATGRPGPTVMEHVLKLNLPHPIPVVCNNGARGMFCQALLKKDTVWTEPVFSNPVSKEITKRVIALAEKHNQVVQYYNATDVYANPSKEHHYALTKRYMRTSGCNTIYVKDSFQSLLQKKNESPSKLLVLCPEEHMSHVLEAFRKEFDTSEATIVCGGTATRKAFFLEVLHPQVCKGTGLEYMCQALHLVPDEVVAFGDNVNDVEFLRTAGCGVAMSNARIEAKSVADRIAEHTNDEVCYN